MLFTYLNRELRRRYRQTAVIVIGLAVGIGLVITVTAATAGVGLAQEEVLHALYGVGTDITLSRAPAAGPTGPSFQPPTGPEGQRYSIDILTSRPFGTLDASTADSVARLPDVAAVSSSLQLSDLNFQGTYGSDGPVTKSPPGSSAGSSDGPNVTATLVDGVPVGVRDLGPITASEITRGRFFTTADSTADNALASTSYASQLHLALGSTVRVGGAYFKIVGMVDSPSSVSVYIPLHVAQTLVNLPGKVTQIDVRASSATQISAVQSEIHHLVPDATITTSRDLANEITGSLSSVSTLINRLGLWLAVAVLIVAFGIATLLTISAVSHRVRDFGTLKALGWPVRRIVIQVMAESLVQGAIGGILGVALGYGGAALLTRLLAHLDLDARNGPGSDVTVHLTAQVQTEALILAVCLAAAGGLIAGLFGGWRAASLRPAVALRRVE